MTPPPGWWSLEDVAAASGYDVAHLKALCDNGWILSARMLWGYWYIDIKELAEMQAE